MDVTDRWSREAEALSLLAPFPTGRLSGITAGPLTRARPILDGVARARRRLNCAPRAISPAQAIVVNRSAMLTNEA